MTKRTWNQLTLTIALTLGFVALFAGTSVACPQGGGGYGRIGGGRGPSLGLYGRNRSAHGFAQKHATGNGYQGATAVASVPAKVESTNTATVQLASYENHTNVGSTIGFGMYPGYTFPTGPATPVVNEPALESMPVDTQAANENEQTASPSDSITATPAVAVADQPGVAPTIVVVQSTTGATSELLVQGDNFGSETGHVYFDLGGVRLTLDVATWDGAAVRVKLPTIEVSSATTTRLVVARADGATSQPYELSNAPATVVAAN